MVLYSALWLIIVAIDRITKAWALQHCVDQYAITPWLSCSLTFNRGVSWSLFHSESSTIFAAVTCLVMAVMVWVAVHAYHRYRDSETIYGEVFVLAGAFSNSIDRFFYGAVIDFIEFDFGYFVWPLFNFADIFIVIGVMVMMFEIVQQEATGL